MSKLRLREASDLLKVTDQRYDGTGTQTWTDIEVHFVLDCPLALWSVKEQVLVRSRGIGRRTSGPCSKPPVS